MLEITVHSVLEVHGFTFVALHARGKGELWIIGFAIRPDGSCRVICLGRAPSISTLQICADYVSKFVKPIVSVDYVGVYQHE